MQIKVFHAIGSLILAWNPLWAERQETEIWKQSGLIVLYGNTQVSLDYPLWSTCPPFSQEIFSGLFSYLVFGWEETIFFVPLSDFNMWRKWSHKWWEWWKMGMWLFSLREKLREWFPLLKKVAVYLIQSAKNSHALSVESILSKWLKWNHFRI